MKQFIDENVKVYVKGKEFKIEKFLGKGKAGYSYLIVNGSEKYVYKKIHHEPCEFYNFGNKIGAELEAYEQLSNVGIRIPELIECNETEEYIIKEYIDGNTVAEMAALGMLGEKEIELGFAIEGLLHKNNLNIDFFPTNFVAYQNELVYVDYECNSYIEEWDFEHWGIFFWLNNEGMKEYVETGKQGKICKLNSPKPFDEPFMEKAKFLTEKYCKKSKP